MSNYPMQPGTRRFGEQPGTGGADRWDKNLEMMDPPPLGKAHEIRPVPGLCTVIYHYINFISTKDGDVKGFPVLCPNWDIGEQAETMGDCPICRDFHSHLAIKDDKWEFLRMPKKFRYLFHAFNLTRIRAGDRENAFGLVQTHPLGMQSIDKSVQIEGVPVDDPENGFTLKWLRTETKKGKFKEEVTFQAGESIPIRWSTKKECWAIRVDGKWYIGREQNYLAAITDVSTGEDLQRKLAELNLYDQLASGTKRGPAEPGLGSRKAKDEDFDLDDDLDNDELEDEEEEERPKKTSKKGKKRSKPVDDVDIDDEFDEDEEPPKKTKKKGKKSKKPADDLDDEFAEDEEEAPTKSRKKKQTADDDDDNWDEDELEEQDWSATKKSSKKSKSDDYDPDEDEDEEDERPAKKSRKRKVKEDEDEFEDEDEDEEEPKKAKKKSKKSSGKKSKKDEDEDEEFDADELDDEDWDD